MFTTLTLGLGPGSGLIDTTEEEAEWYASPEDRQHETAIGDVVPDAEIEPPSQAASNDETMTKVRGDQAKHDEDVDDDDDYDGEVKGEEEEEKEEEQEHDQDTNTLEVVEETGEYRISKG
jgi:hypothetical protein